MTVILCFSTGRTTVNAEDYLNGHTGHDDFRKWTDTGSLPKSQGNYYLDSDVVLNSTWNVPFGDVRLCRNGHSITMNTDGDIIRIESSRLLLRM